MSLHRWAIGTALIGTALSLSPLSACAITERSVEPRDAGTDASSTGPADGGADGNGGTSSGGKGAGGSTAGTSSGGASPEDAAADASNDANAATGGVTASGGAGGGGAPTTRDAGSDSCRRLPGLGDVILCDDFEKPELSSQWRPFTSDGSEGSTHIVPGPFPHRGEWGLISTKGAPGPRNPLFADVLGGRTSGHLYLRAWMYFPSEAPITDHPLASATLFVLGENQGPAYRGCGVALWRGRLTTQCNGAQGGSYAAPPDTLPADRWICVRYDFPIGDAVPAAELRVRIGDATLPNAMTTPTTTSLDTGYTRVWLGLNHISEYQAKTVVVYYDDVVVDSEDIACD